MLPNLAAVIFCDGEASFSLFLCASLVTKKLITTDTTKEKRRGEKKRETERGISVIECVRVASSADHLQMRCGAGNSGAQERTKSADTRFPKRRVLSRNTHAGKVPSSTLRQNIIFPWVTFIVPIRDVVGLNLGQCAGNHRKV